MPDKEFKDYLKIQKKFSDLFFDVDSLSENEKIERHKIFGLGLHSEVTSLTETFTCLIVNRFRFSKTSCFTHT